jgi:hypothetical protein
MTSGDPACLRVSSRSLHRDGEAPRSQLIGWTRQTVHEPKHDIELSPVQNRGRFKIDVDRSGPSFGGLECDEWSRCGHRERHEVRRRGPPWRYAGGPLANAIGPVGTTDFGRALNKERGIGGSPVHVDVDLRAEAAVDCRRGCHVDDARANAKGRSQLLAMGSPRLS